MVPPRLARSTRPFASRIYRGICAAVPPTALGERKPSRSSRTTPAPLKRTRHARASLSGRERRTSVWPTKARRRSQSRRLPRKRSDPPEPLLRDRIDVSDASSFRFLCQALGCIRAERLNGSSGLTCRWLGAAHRSGESPAAFGCRSSMREEASVGGKGSPRCTLPSEACRVHPATPAETRPQIRVL